MIFNAGRKISPEIYSANFETAKNSYLSSIIYRWVLTRTREIVAQVVVPQSPPLIAAAWGLGLARD